MTVSDSIARQSLATGLMCVLVGSAVDARADDLTKEQCVEANESAQTLRRDGKLRAARAQLLICLANSCPGPVRDDCAERMTALERAAPTIVFAAKGPAGNTLRAVKVTMDGARLADHLDGAGLVVDPGEHVFALVADGYTSVSKKLVIREGAKGRKEVVIFRSTAPSPEIEPVPAAVSVAKPEPRSESFGSDRRTIAYVFGGAGVVGLGLGTALLVYPNVEYARCRDGCAKADVDSANAWVTGSVIAFALGGALLATGVVVFLTAPKDGSVTLQPSVGSSSAGIQLGGIW